MEHKINHEEASHVASEAKKRDTLLPVSIIVAAILIAGALIYNAGNKTEPATTRRAADVLLRPTQIKLAPITASDHIQGDANAPLKIVEYSDLECPYCQVFHSTMQQVMEVYRGKVAWVYRHFPLTEIHPKATPLALASECVAALGGNDPFWKFIDRIFSTPSIESFSLDSIPSVAASLGVDRTALETCRSSKLYESRVSADATSGATAGVRGTPYSVIVSPKGNTYVIPGALPFDVDPNNPESVSVREIIDAALKN